MRPSLPPNMGDNAAAQATLEARLRREQVKRVSQVEDLSNVVGNAADGQALVYSQAKGAWQPGAAGGASIMRMGNGGAAQSIPTGTETVLSTTYSGVMAGSSFGAVAVDNKTFTFTADAVCLVVARATWPLGAAPSYEQLFQMYAATAAAVTGGGPTPIGIDDELRAGGPPTPISKLTEPYQFFNGDSLCCSAWQNSGASKSVASYQVWIFKLG